MSNAVYATSPKPSGESRSGADAVPTGQFHDSAAEKRPLEILELGTSLGITTAYLAAP